MNIKDLNWCKGFKLNSTWKRYIVTEILCYLVEKRVG